MLVMLSNLLLLKQSRATTNHQQSLQVKEVNLGEELRLAGTLF